MTSTTKPVSAMRALCHVKARLHREMATMQRHDGDHARAAKQLVEIFVREYQPGLDDLIAATDPALLASRLRAIAERLERGISVEGDEANALFKRLLLELEVLNDVLAVGYTDGGQTPLVAMLERIERWKPAV